VCVCGVRIFIFDLHYRFHTAKKLSRFLLSQLKILNIFSYINGQKLKLHDYLRKLVYVFLY